MPPRADAARRLPVPPVRIPGIPGRRAGRRFGVGNVRGGGAAWPDARHSGPRRVPHPTGCARTPCPPPAVGPPWRADPEIPPGAWPTSPRLPVDRRSEPAAGPAGVRAPGRRAGLVPGSGRHLAREEAGVRRSLPGEGSRSGRDVSGRRSVGHDADRGPAGGLTRHRIRRPGRSAGPVAEVVLWRGGSSAPTMNSGEAMSGRPHSRRMDPWVRDTQIEGIS